jgi:hypothetical protein
MFEGWGEFYLMIGSAGAALVGLLFVVVTLTSGLTEDRAIQGQALFMTPTMLTFGMVLAGSAMALAPEIADIWRALLTAAAALFGLAYAVRASIGLARGKPPIVPHWSDFWFYGVAPGALYLGLLGAAIAIGVESETAPHALASVLTLLMLLGVRNAWDLVTWIAPHAKAD